MNKWINPEPRVKSEFPPQDATTYIPRTTFNTIKNQVQKKKTNKKSKKDRLIEKALVLSHRLGKS